MMRGVVAAALAAWLAPGLAAAAELRTAAEIDACYQANFPAETSVQTVALRAVDRIGAVTETRAKLYWKRFEDDRSGLLMRFERPLEVRGAALLMLEKPERTDMFIYLPELGRVKRVTRRMTSASMFGTDFSYEEFERMQGIASSPDLERGEDATLDGRPAYVLLAKALEEEDSAYRLVISYIDKETCVLLRSEFYEKGETPRKVLSADPSTLLQEGGVWLAREMRIRDLRDGTETTLVIQEVEIDEPLPRKLFSQRELEAGGS